MFEYEKKIILSDDEYFILQQIKGKDSPTITQINYYYDFNDFSMNKKGVTCRIREKDGIYQATIKEHNQRIEDCSVEHSMKVFNEHDNRLFVDMGLILQGCLTTERTILYSDKICEVVLDKNIYLGCTDYELEIEYLPQYEEHSEHLLNQIAHILYSHNSMFSINTFMEKVNSSKNKSERFFERKKALQRKKNFNP